MRRIIYIMLIAALLLPGCSATKTSNAGNETATPTPVKKMELPKADSSKEAFRVYTEKDKEEIIKLSQNYTGAHGGSFAFAYYEYYDMLDTSLPIVISLDAEKASEKFGGTWVLAEPATDFSGVTNTDWSYGIMTVKQIKEMCEGEENYEIYLAPDSTVKPVHDGVVRLEDVGVEHFSQLQIYDSRKNGDVEIIIQSDKCIFDQRILVDWEFY